MLLLLTLISFLPLALAANLYVAPTTVNISQPGDVIILRGVLHVERIHYWNFRRLTFTHGPYGYYVKDSGNLRFNQIVTRDNYESGFHMQGALSSNVISYLDSYGNRDPRNSGENADGIAIKEGKGEGNIVVGSRFWDNPYIGVDFWEFHSKLIIKDSFARGNGYNRWNLANFTGNGNGFKLGGGSAVDILLAGREVVDCIAFGYRANGFTDNSWDSPAPLLTKQSFRSVDAGLVAGARNKNGKIAASDFLVLADGARRGATTAWK
ncbi:Pectate lyase L [Colletotrichum orbiculare MAFF 240422]|uniref:Pectate lyase L n=1 Tax=Colletotrichum orbiculare (strain 104-T / ATCC 96160 / CBS 514.97 / LARS 414 / MAFF 240422) TaxID=1213857 RepID=N4VKW8_COLOR|nr:Pectate lyase L [Colletotrichum orbiculare MAFF 240422]